MAQIEELGNDSTALRDLLTDLLLKSWILAFWSELLASIRWIPWHRESLAANKGWLIAITGCLDKALFQIQIQGRKKGPVPIPKWELGLKNHRIAVGRTKTGIYGVVWIPGKDALHQKDNREPTVILEIAFLSNQWLNREANP